MFLIGYTIMERMIRIFDHPRPGMLSQARATRSGLQRVGVWSKLVMFDKSYFLYRMPTAEAPRVSQEAPQAAEPLEGEHSLTIEGAVEEYLKSQNFHPSVDKEVMLNAILDIFDEHGEKIPAGQEQAFKDRAWDYFLQKA